ncbi:MAG: polysaccharide biosynthesis/export family protein [Bryobacteraceae bacterium]
MKAPQVEQDRPALGACCVALALLVLATAGLASPPAGKEGPPSAGEQARSTYVLGPGDQILVRVLDLEEMGKEPYQIDMRGNVNLPMAGRIHASGLTVEELEQEIGGRLKKFLKTPEVSVGLSEMRSQPVSVLGEVKNPGVLQLQGEKTLLEVVSMAGGLNPAAGHSIRITRKKEWGEIPLPGAREDETGQYYVAEVGVKEILEARAPEKNILVKPNDVITVPKGELVYVMGAVKKSGGFVLGDRENVTVLQALSMAEGMDSYAESGHAKILRRTSNPEKRQEIALNLKRILEGKDHDVEMQSDDILFVPVSGGKKALARTAEAGLAIGTGLAIYTR